MPRLHAVNNVYTAFGLYVCAAVTRFTDTFARTAVVIYYAHLVGWLRTCTFGYVTVWLRTFAGCAPCSRGRSFGLVATFARTLRLFVPLYHGSGRFPVIYTDLDCVVYYAHFDLWIFYVCLFGLQLRTFTLRLVIYVVRLRLHFGLITRVVALHTLEDFGAHVILITFDYVYVVVDLRCCVCCTLF